MSVIISKYFLYISYKTNLIVHFSYTKINGALFEILDNIKRYL